MRRHLLAIGAVVSLLLLNSAPLRAQVRAVSVSPASPIVNQAATVTVTGTDPCGAVHIDFGDGMAQTYPITGLSFSTQHTWATTGTKTITATGQGNCAGQASLTVQVTQSNNIAQLCARINCGERPKMFSLKPEITALYGSSTPGAFLAVAGTGFGTNPGSLVASLRNVLGQSFQRTLEVIEWTDTMVVVQWPPDIAGVRRQSAALALTNASSGKRDWRSVTFSPALDLKPVPQADVRVLSCGDDGNYDICNSVVDASDGGTFNPIDPGNPIYPGFPIEFSSHAIAGMHINDWGTIGDDTGTDVYQIELRNDWILESFHWKVSAEPGEGSVRKPTGFTKGASWSPSIYWEVTPNDEVIYAAVLTMTGPIGVPHKSIVGQK